MAKCLYFRQIMANNDPGGHTLPNQDQPMSSVHTQSPSLPTNNNTCPPAPVNPMSNPGLIGDLLTTPEASSSSDHFDSLPSLNEVILEHELFRWGLGLGEEENKVIMDNSNNPTLRQTTSRNATPTNTPPILTPRLCPSPTQANPILVPQHSLKNSFNQLREMESGAFSDVSSNASSVSDTSGTNWRNLMQSDPMRPSGTFRSLATGLDPIPEDGVSNPPTVYQPLVPPSITKPATTSYNISFPTTLQPRDRFDLWSAAVTGSINKHRGIVGTAGSSPEGASSSSVPPSPGSLSNQQSPFHGAFRSTPWDPNEFHPINHLGGEDTTQPPSAAGSDRVKPSHKRSRSSRPSSEHGGDDEDIDDGASLRQKRKSSNALSNNNTTESKRRDSIKFGLEELQRVLPHIGKPEEERISQASVLQEGGKYIRNLKTNQAKVSAEITAVKNHIDELNNQIEALQNMLPANGAPLLPKVMTMRNLPDMFHDHVVKKTMEDWKYWIFVSIMGHFVHSFEQQVSASTYEDLQTTSVEYVANNLTLQQLRKDAYRKLAKLCSKTSIVETPSKLPEEAMAFVTRGDRAFKKENA